MMIMENVARFNVPRTMQTNPPVINARKIVENRRRQKSGKCYFALLNASHINAAVSAFRSTTMKLEVVDAKTCDIFRRRNEKSTEIRWLFPFFQLNNRILNCVACYSVRGRRNDDHTDNEYSNFSSQLLGRLTPLKCSVGGDDSTNYKLNFHSAIFLDGSVEMPLYTGEMSK